MKKFHWFHLISGRKFSLVKLIPLLALVAVVWMNTLVLHKGLTGGWTKISQLVNQRDMRLIARLIAQNPAECQKMNTQALSLYIRAQINPDISRLIGLHDWDQDIWGQPYMIDILPDKIVIISSGPDRTLETSDDAKFVLPLKPETPAQPEDVP